MGQKLVAGHASESDELALLPVIRPLSLRSTVRPGAVKLTHGLTALPVSMSASALIVGCRSYSYGHVASCERLFALLETATRMYHTMISLLK